MWLHRFCQAFIITTLADQLSGVHYDCSYLSHNRNNPNCQGHPSNNRNSGAITLDTGTNPEGNPNKIDAEGKPTRGANKFRNGLNAISGCDDWGYIAGRNDPALWITSCPTSCAGTSQSPIDIDTDNVETDREIGEIFMYGYDTKEKQKAKNSGNSAKFTWKTVDGYPFMTASHLGGERYVFSNYHFHWGADSSQGSEHTVDGKKYPMEVHFVHYNAKYGSLADALATGNGDALAVLGFFFEISDDDNEDMDKVISYLDDIRVEGTPTDVEISEKIPVGMFMPKEGLQDFYYYNGSLTTPSCDEVVVWTVFKKTIPISESQMSLFRAMQYTDGSTEIVNNYRPTQPLNGRTVHFATSKLVTTVNLTNLAIIVIVASAVGAGLSALFDANFASLNQRRRFGVKSQRSAYADHVRDFVYNGIDSLTKKYQ